MNDIWDEVQGDCDVTRIRVALNANPGVKASKIVLDGWTPLHYACENRTVDDATRAATIQILVEAQANVNAVDEVQ